MWKSRQRSAQSSGISVELTSTRPLADRGVDLAQLRQLALAAVDRVLDVAGAALLLDPVGRQHGQLGEDQLGLVGRARSGPASRINRRRGGRG